MQQPIEDRSRHHASPKTVSPATLTDMDISRQRLSEWREVRDAGTEAAPQTSFDQLWNYFITLKT